ncbi:uncharacterized protein MEPE_02663 [Melanopsichium pennsylvanicum]|uniref:Uncharacterized protein n=2 Tax=Melanopsichium pennsylvanicum TaxID=63383 RepID=A0AAJ5C4S2_9BASI|nr:conserved hypothetical protein [Melanopsichium pennsylvanicum 4]SNX83955.1 uncharacterized protein MEPE_02663 [Melanopsichium pennsylvanicum]
MKDDTPSPSSQPSGEHASLPNTDNSTSPAQLPSASARQTHIRQSASESDVPISFAHPFIDRESSNAASPACPRRDISTDSTDIGHGSRLPSEDSEWNDEGPSSPWDRRAANPSSGSSTPLKVRRRGLANDKKLTISVYGPPSSKGSPNRRVASENNTSATKPKTPSSSDIPTRPAPTTRVPSYRSKLAHVSPGSKLKKDSPTDSLAPPPSARIRWAPVSPTMHSPLGGGSPTGKSGSPSSSENAASSGRSDKTLFSSPSYGFNPDFQLGTSNKKSPRSDGDDTSPTKPSPTYSGVSVGGVKSLLYSNARVPSTPLSPRAPIPSSSPHSNKLSSSPRYLRTPKTPTTPRTPLTSRLPRTPGSGSISAHSGASYQGVLLTTVTRTAAGSDPAQASNAAESSTTAAERRTRSRGATIGTEIRDFVRGGASEVVPRLELRVLERPRRSTLYGLNPDQVPFALSQTQRHSLTAAQSNTLKDKTEEAGTDENEKDESSPRTNSFARGSPLDKPNGKRSSVAGKPATRRASSAASVTSYGLYRSPRRERRPTNATTASGRSGRSARSGVSRRVSMPTVTNASIKSSSLADKRLSLASSSVRGHRDSSVRQDENGEGENDMVGEIHSQVNNINEAKRWILGYRPAHDTNAAAVMGRDIVDDNRSVSAMRRPTYAASVFQQARLMEIERQADAAFTSGSALNVSSSVNQSANHISRLPMGLPPRTPIFPKTPLTAIPVGNEDEVELESDPQTALAVLPQPTWKEKGIYYACAPFRFIKQQIDPKYVLSMMDPREILFPLTLRKVALWIVYAGVIAMLVLLDHYYHWWHKLDHAVHGKNLAIMGVLYGFEPAMIIIIMLVARVPDARVVPDRTVLVPRGRDSSEEDSDAESRSSISSDGSEDSVAEEDRRNQMHSIILEEEHDHHEPDREMQERETAEEEKGTRRLSGMSKAHLRRTSTRHTTASSNTSADGGRRGSEAISHTSGNVQAPRTPGFDPRNRRSTIILHEPLNIDLQLERQLPRRPSTPSHQMVLAQTASRESNRRNSYFSIVASAAGSRLVPPSPLAANHTIGDDWTEEKDDKILGPTESTSSAQVQDEKQAVGAHLAEESKPDEVRIAMGSVTHPSHTESTALIIPCHNADVEVLKAVLFAALVHFEPWQIFVVDNGNTPQPPSDMESAIRSQPMFARVNYIWLPVGNKNIAQFVGAKAAAVLDLDFVLTIDDDVIIPANFAAPMHIISEIVTAVCYPITAVDHKGDRPLFVGWQDIEYKMSALAKMAESKMCGVLFPHGAASFWKRQTMIDVLRGHDLVYFADDVKMGLQLQALGQKMGIDASISFETVAPETFLGPPSAGTANYYHQRVRSWEMARHTLYWQFTKRFLFSLNGARTPVAIGWQKFTQFYNSTTNFIDWIRLPMFILLGGSGQFWLRSFAFIFFLPIVPLIPYRFIKTRNRPDLHPHMLDMLTFGIYKLMYSLVCILGGIRSMLVFFPNHAHKPTLMEMEKKGDERCIWLRDDFMKNSGGQGDLRDEPQQILLDDEALAEAVAIEEEQGQEMVETALVSALPSNAEEGQVNAINVKRSPSRSPPEELPTVHEIR